MSQDEGRTPANARPTNDPAMPGNESALRVADRADLTPAQRWAAAWLAGPHGTGADCGTCAAGWTLLDGGGAA